jgi:hypothetical protein
VVRDPSPLRRRPGRSVLPPSSAESGTEVTRVHRRQPKKIWSVVDTLAEGVRDLAFDINLEEVETEMSKTSCCLKKLKEVFPKYSSDFKTRKQVDKHPRFVRPRELHLGYSDDIVLTSTGIDIRHIPKTAAVVSLKETISSLMQDK